MAEDLPDAPWVTGEEPDAPWAKRQEQGVPRAFMDRLLDGENFKRALQSTTAGVVKAGQGFVEGFGNDRLGLSEEHTQQLRELTGNSLFLNTVFEQGAVPIDALLRTVTGSVHALGALVGQHAEDVEKTFGGDIGANKARSETVNFLNYLMMRGDIQTSRIHYDPTGVYGPRAQTIGTLPRDADFNTGNKAVDANLRNKWQEDGVHPAEVLHDAKSDAFIKQELERSPTHYADESGIPHPQGSPVPEGTPRAQQALTGEEYIDRLLQTEVTRETIDNPNVIDTFDVPYTAAGSKDLPNRDFYIDKDFPRQMTVDGVTYDPAHFFATHDNIEQHGMIILMKELGWSAERAYSFAHYELAEKAEAAMYRANGIDPAHAEAAYKPITDLIQRKKDIKPPPDMFKPEYPGGNPHRAATEDTAAAKPTAEDIAAGKKAILDYLDRTEKPEGELHPLGADVSGAPSLAQQPPPPPGRLSSMFTTVADKLFDIGRDIQMKLAPMARGSNPAMAMAKDFANALRKNRWEWARIDDDIVKRFTPEERRQMWEAADEESVARQLGTTEEQQRIAGSGLSRLSPEQRAFLEDLNTRAQDAWVKARDAGMVEGEGLPFYTPRMVLNTANAVGEGPRVLNGIGQNLRTTTPQLKQRKYLTAGETEAAAKAKYGEEAEVARDIRTMPLAVSKLEDAIAGRTLINNIRDYGRSTGTQTVAEGFKPGEGWFTVDHPAFRTWKPKFEIVDDKAVPIKDSEGNIVFEQTPLYVHPDFEGPLRAVLSQRNGTAYNMMMSLKGKTMSLIMYTPAIHNLVEWGRAFPAMPGKLITFRVYRDGNLARKDIGTMHEAIDAGLVPIGKRFFNQDLSSIMEAPDLTPGRSWTAKITGAVPGLFDEGAEIATKRAIDRMGDFWHNTLLWDQISKLQVGLYVNFRDEAMARGIDRRTASLVAAHWANRYAGALPQEAMSANARKISNMLLFSRTFTLGNMGVLKDVLTGLPKDVLAQIERDGGFRAGAIDQAGESAGPQQDAVKYAKGIARRKAMMTVGLDIGLMYVGNSLLQNVMNVLTGDSTLEKELHGYAERMGNALSEVKENPIKVLQPFQFLENLSATSENEPGKQDRIRVGHAKDGTAIYMRNPTGKIGEEMIGYLTGPLDMFRRKQSTFAAPAWDVLSNDAGFGHKVIDKNADTPGKYVENIARVFGHIAARQIPLDQMTTAKDLVMGDGDPKTNTLKTVGPFFGLTFAKGAPGGEALGELYHAKTMHDFAVQNALPDIRKQILRGDVEGAQTRMTELGINKGLQRFYIHSTQDPTRRISARALRDFGIYATPEQKARMERAQGAQP